MPFPALQSLFDPLLPSGLQWYWKGDYVRELSDKAIDTHLRWAAEAPSELSLMHCYPIDGAVHRVGAGETAWSFRDARVVHGQRRNRSRPREGGALTAWAKGYWEAMRPYTLGGAYVNFMMDEGLDRVKATYRDNYARLAEIKRRYDPDNFFRINQNIRPD
jgi:Berberine and berberine like